MSHLNICDIKKKDHDYVHVYALSTHGNFRLVKAPA